jgi:hypothetical protein
VLRELEVGNIFAKITINFPDSGQLFRKRVDKRPLKCAKWNLPITQCGVNEPTIFMLPDYIS